MKISKVLELVRQAWKNLDTSLIKELLAEEVIYESQWLLYQVRGKSNVINYLDVLFNGISAGISLNRIEFIVEPNQTIGTDLEHSIKLQRKSVDENRESLVFVTLGAGSLINKICVVPFDPNLRVSKDNGIDMIGGYEEWEKNEGLSDLIKEKYPDAYCLESYYDKSIIGVDTFNEQVIYDLHNLAHVKMMLQNDVVQIYNDCDIHDWLYQYSTEDMLEIGAYYANKEGKNPPAFMYSVDYDFIYMDTP